MAVSHLSLTFRQLSLRPSAAVQGNLTHGMCCCNLWVAKVGYKGELRCLFQPVCLCVVGRVGATEIIEELSVESRGTDRTLLLSKHLIEASGCSWIQPQPHTLSMVYVNGLNRHY